MRQKHDVKYDSKKNCYNCKICKQTIHPDLINGPCSGPPIFDKDAYGYFAEELRGR